MNRVKAGSMLLTGVALLLLAVAGRADAAPIFWLPNGHYYEVVIDEASTWQNANASAAAAMHNGYRGHLATINSAEEDAFVSQAIRMEVSKITTRIVPPTVFLGGLQAADSIEPAGGWQWVTGEPFTYTNWLPGEPNNWSGNENVLITGSLDAEGRLQWNDGDDWNPMSGYVVEYEPERPRCGSSWVERRITTNLSDQYDPAISGNIVVYTDRREYNGSDVYYTDLATGQEVQVTSALVDQELAKVSDGLIAISDSWFSDVLIYSIADGTTTNLTGGSISLAAQPAIGQTLVAWQGIREVYWDIFAQDLATGEQRRITTGPNDNFRPAVDAGHIVWMQCNTKICAIFAYDWASEATSQLTSFLDFSTEPHVDQSSVVYESSRAGGDWDIYHYDLATGLERRLVRPGDQHEAHVSGDFIAFEEAGADGFSHVKVWHFPTDVVLDTGIGSSSNQFLSDIDGNRLVYTDDRDGQFDIYLAELKCTIPPAANAGPDQSVHPGATATLDGSGSSDPDGNYPLTYAWTLVSKPSASATSLVNPTSVNPSLTPDVPGDYVVELVVTDAMPDSSVPDTVTVSTNNTRPVAIAGPDQGGSLLNLVTLDGSWSYDADGDPLGYRWRFVTLPPGSRAVLSRTTNPSVATFTPDVAGLYEVSLVVNDGYADSDPDNVMVMVFAPFDFVVSALAVPAAAAPGASITVNDATGNRGPNGAPASRTKLYWSNNSTLDVADIEIGSRAVPALSALASSSGSTTVTIPAAACSGTFYIIAKADGNNALPEANETNNTTARIIKTGPDLIIPVLTGPATAGAGQSITLIETTQNNGGCPAGPSTTRFYLSANASWGTSDRELFSRDVGPLLAGASSPGSVSITIPADTAAGTYHIIAKADASGAVPETSEINNTSYLSVRIGPDLIVPDMTGPTEGGAGKIVTVGAMTRNRGAGSAKVSATKFYLSTNSRWDALDKEIGESEVPALAGGDTYWGNADVFIPLDTTAGVYYIIAKADAPEVIAETSEANNTNSKSITIGPDLVVSSITAPTSAARGATIRISDTTRNNGGGATGSPFKTAMFLSRDRTFESGVDIPLYTRDVAQLQELTSSVGSLTTWTIPAGMPPGTYYLIGVADATAAVVETKELNNTKYKAITIN